MSSDPTISGEERDALAAEYVLGVLDAGERQAVEQRMARDPGFAAEVAFWEQRLAPLVNEVAAVMPPAGVWSGIEARLGGRRRLPNLWNSLLFWRWSAVASAALAAASLAVIYVGLVAPARAPLVATLENDGRPGFLAAVEPGRSSITILPAALSPVEQRVLELWLIAPGDTPRSLGLIQAGQPVRISVPAALVGRLSADAALAVSLEPPGGSPTGAPTGPVIASGKLTRL